MTTALMVIDIQRWFFRKPDRLVGLPGLIEKTNELSEVFRSRQLPVVRIVTVHKEDRSTWSQIMKRDNLSVMIEGTPDVEEFPELLTHETDIVVEKTRHSAFIRTGLEQRLRDHQVDTLVVGGAFADACVGLTAIEAYERDFGVAIASEATLSLSEYHGPAMLSLLEHEFEVSQLDNSAVLRLIANTPGRQRPGG